MASRTGLPVRTAPFSAVPGNDTAARASDVWKKTLEEYEKPPIEDDLEAELKAYVDRRRTELGD